MLSIRVAFVFVAILLIAADFGSAQDGTFFLKASKSVPRIGKRSKSNSNDDFEKFFLKASKSVPRIGRRGSPSEGVLTEPQSDLMKFAGWSDVSDLYEFHPELFTSPQFVSKFEDYEMMGDDPHIAWDKPRFKRTNIPSDYSHNKELFEYRLQPQQIN